MRKKDKQKNYSIQKEDVKQLLKRIAVTIFILMFYNLLTYVTIPGINPHSLEILQHNTALETLSLFSGGSFQTLSLLSLGVSAYISAQIIIQLLQAGVVPILTEWSKQGQVGRRKLTQATRAVAGILSFVQSIGIIAGVTTLADDEFVIVNPTWDFVVVATLMTAGTFIALWLADQITDRGLGNGVSVIIAAGIVKKLPMMVQRFGQGVSKHGQIAWGKIAIAAVVVFLTVLLIVWFNRSEYRVRIQYSRRETLAPEDSYLPLKIVVSNVVPIIFASSIFTIPQTLLMFFKSHSNETWFRIIYSFFDLNSFSGIIMFAALIVLFSYIYSLVQIEPERLADNLLKQEAYIPGIYPGENTAQYIKDRLYDLDLPGAAFLTLISVVPMVVSHFVDVDFQLGLTGSSVLIIVGVLNELQRQIEGLRMKHNYAKILDTHYYLD